MHLPLFHWLSSQHGAQMPVFAPPQKKKLKLPPDPELEATTPQYFPKGGKGQQQAIEHVDGVQMEQQASEESLKIKQKYNKLHQLFAEEVRIDRQNPTFGGNNICQPSTHVCCSGRRMKRCRFIWQELKWQNVKIWDIKSGYRTDFILTKTLT